MDKKLSDDYIKNMYLEGGEIVHENALAALVEFDVLYNVPYRDKGYGFRDDIHVIVHAVNLNDIFWWACADWELISYDDIKDLYERCFDKNGNYKPWGSVVWGCLKRGMRPQHPIEERMKEGGYWCDELEALPVRDFTG